LAYAEAGALVSNGNIDASVDLAFSLKVCAVYRQNGLLQATVHHVPGIKGNCKATIQLQQGNVVACFLEDSKGQRRLTTKEVLIRVDDEKGPFEWTLLPQATALTATPPVKSRPERRAVVPKRFVQHLDMRLLQTFLPWQKSLLFTVFTAVDGQRTIEEIQAVTQVPPAKVAEALRVLASLRLVVIP
jgi:hypothetical protein